MLYQILLSLAFPSPDAPDDFSIVKPEIEKAIEKFSVKFKGKKRLSLVKAAQNITVDLETFVPVKNPTREISALSQILKTDYQWSKYSQSKNRIFNADLINVTPVEETSLNTSNSSDFSKELTKAILIETDSETIDKYIAEFETLLELSKARKIILQVSKSV